MIYQVTKRGFDLIIASTILLIVIPIIGTVSLLLFLVTNENPIFIQPRVGYQEQIFSLYKLRTMYSDKLYQQRPWLKKLCQWLRQYSVDELPQLWNILKGDMSLVGPRPLLTEYLPFYNEYQRKRHTVKPGMSGWAQVKGRNTLPWPQRFHLDVWYTENQSFQLDTKIIYYTILHLFQPKGVRPEGLSVAEKFTGN